MWGMTSCVRLWDREVMASCMKLERVSITFWRLRWWPWACKGRKHCLECLFCFSSRSKKAVRVSLSWCNASSRISRHVMQKMTKRLLEKVAFFSCEEKIRRAQKRGRLLNDVKDTFSARRIGVIFYNFQFSFGLLAFVSSIFDTKVNESWFLSLVRPRKLKHQKLLCCQLLTYYWEGAIEQNKF